MPTNSVYSINSNTTVDIYNYKLKKVEESPMKEPQMKSVKHMNTIIPINDIVNNFEPLIPVNNPKTPIETTKKNIEKNNFYNYIKSFFISEKKDISNEKFEPPKEEIIDTKNTSNKINYNFRGRSIKDEIINNNSIKNRSNKISDFIGNSNKISSYISNKSSIVDFTELLKSDELVCKNISNNLHKIMNSDISYNNTIISERQNPNIFIEDWSSPPETYGLENSERIFGQYYLTGKDLNGKIVNIDFLFTIFDNIRNFRPLTVYQLEYIKSLDNLAHIMIINEFNNSMEILKNNYEMILDNMD
uniref:Uncharacterized protein n=1 Tax=viral metagenome TaxID=1070528 RepID=A0A6C0HST3_9ZZZZ